MIICKYAPMREAIGFARRYFTLFLAADAHVPPTTDGEALLFASASAGKSVLDMVNEPLKAKIKARKPACSLTPITENCPATGSGPLSHAAVMLKSCGSHAEVRKRNSCCMRRCCGEQVPSMPGRAEEV